MSSTPKPYGLWTSPIGVGDVSSALSLSDVQIDESGNLVWLERRSGRGVLVCRPAGGDGPRDLTTDLPVRAEVGYGGGDFAVGNGQVFFASEHRLYRQSLTEGLAQPITPPWGSSASPAPSPDGRWLAYVHSHDGVDVLAAACAHGKHWPFKVFEGNDFYMQPTWHPEGTHLAWIAWDHPNMPWQGSGLFLAEVRSEESSFRLGSPHLAAGDPRGREAVSQPLFSPDGRRLCYLSDHSGWTIPWLLDLQSGEGRPLFEGRGAEYGGPAWVQGVRSYAWRDEDSLLVVRSQGGFSRLQRLDIESGRVDDLQPMKEYASVQQPAVGSRKLAFIGSAPRIPQRVVVVENERARIERRSQSESVPQDALSRPLVLEIPLEASSAEDPDCCSGLYYPPHNNKHHCPGAPPALIHIHGGPSSQSTAEYSAEAQFFATRGFGFLKLNYRGSTGYGRRFCDALQSGWGEVEVEDVVAAADHLISEGLADGGRLVVSGGSAGGFTVLLCLVRHPGRFRAGICRYGIGNLFDLAAQTHKFEAKYLDWLIGPLPEAADVYRDRSAVFQADRICDPLAIFQGGEDKAVPPNQAEAIVAALKERGVPHLYRFYPDEGHGFRRRENIADYYQSVEDFLLRHVVFAPPPGSAGRS